MRYDPIDNQLFIDNRKRFTEKMKPGSIAVFNSSDIMPKSADGVHRFVQQTDLFYLSGIDQEESVLVLFPDAVEKKHREILFLRETNEKIAVWEGEKLTQDQAKEISGIRTVYWTSRFEELFRELVFQAERIYLNTNEHTRADVSVETRDARFLKWCKGAYPLHHYERSAPILHELRAVKSAIEVELIRKACSITEKAFRRVLTFMRPGVWEFEIEAEILHEFLMNRSRGPAYDSIVASGANACILHYIQNNRQCKDGDLVLMDFGAEYANYASDMTRTVPVSGRFSQRQKDIYNAVLRVQRAATEMLRPGLKWNQLQKETGNLMEKELIDLGLLDPEKVKEQDVNNPLYKKYFMHGVSHHMGLDVHDYGSRHRIFEPGMVFTCEPGLYIKEEGIGIRIENDILITDNGPVDLMRNIPVEVEEIEDLMNK